MSRSQIIAACLLIVATYLVVVAASRPGPLLVEDCFGRAIGARGLTLVDWDGYIANPAIRFDVVAPAAASYPARLVIRGDHPRLAFDLPSTAGAGGPTKEIRLARAGRTSIRVAIFPDRDGRDEDHALTIDLEDAGGRRRSARVPLHLVDQDREEEADVRPRRLPIVVDFSQDRTGFFEDEARRRVARRAAADWSYFLDGEGAGTVAAGDESTLIWNPDGFRSTRTVKNESPFTGYLLYAYGIDGPDLRSGGEPSPTSGFQTRGADVLPLRRSGGYEVEIKGNYNREGWRADLSDDEWWKATNLRDDRADLDSIAHHEIGHALIFNRLNPRFGDAKQSQSATLRDDRLRAYLGKDPTIDGSDHLPGTVDPASLRGAFGNEYHGKMPRGRWLITKADLIAARAVGYDLRATSAFIPLTLETAELPEGRLGGRYTTILRASGGVPAYQFQVVEGSLPAGLSLDDFSGEIRGVPTRPGHSEFTVRVRDSEESAQAEEVLQHYRLTIAAP
ncbi:Ig domain-containing protein [Aquisphaera insulae]|uniref:Ig domain-containing protein n=1 Tax=Aquisphaera insulae TaxID=2712864 RepID=UPI0013EB0AC3|nr:Ig domain-containing protein [Aquisphaera insulae]